MNSTFVSGTRRMSYSLRVRLPAASGITATTLWPPCERMG